LNTSPKADLDHSGRFTVHGVGDIAPRRQDPAAILARVADKLREGDLVFGQLETTLSDRGGPLPQARLAMRSDPAVAAVIRQAGVQIVSFAGNHCLDWGREAFTDTLAHARLAGLQVCGAGETIGEARRPVIAIAPGGARVAFLAYSSVLPQDYWAEANRPGCAPLRAHTLYDQVETDQPGTPARTLTFCHRQDLQLARLDVRAAKAEADIVIVSVHWGVHFIPAEIADYQRVAAHALIAEGADAILGHHPHILKGVEIYKGRPIFYSLGNFAIEQPQAFAQDLFSTEGFHDISALNPGFDTKRAFIAPPDTQKSMIVKLAFAQGRIARVAYQPVMIDDDSIPSPLGASDPRFAAVRDYVAEISAAQGLATRFSTDGDDVVVLPAWET